MRMVQQIEPGLQLKYNKHYIGLADSGVARNLVLFRPRRRYVSAEFKIPRSDDLTERLEDSGLTTMPYDTIWNRYRIRVTGSDLDEHTEALANLLATARGAYRASAAIDV